MSDPQTEVLMQSVRYHLTGNQPVPGEMLRNAGAAMDALVQVGRIRGFTSAQSKIMQIIRDTLDGTREGAELATLLNDEIGKLTP